MSLSKNNQLIQELGNDAPFFTEAGISCWQKQQGKLLVHVFTQIFPDGDALLSNYKVLRDHIAVCFQSQGEINDAQRWNLYIFYFVAEKVNQGIKQLIEQDKFSTRKIILDNCGSVITDEFIEQQIDADLFEIKVQTKVAKVTSLDEVIAKGFPNIHEALNKLGAGDTYEILTPLLTYLKDE